MLKHHPLGGEYYKYPIVDWGPWYRLLSLTSIRPRTAAFYGLFQSNLQHPSLNTLHTNVIKILGLFLLRVSFPPTMYVIGF